MKTPAFCCPLIVCALIVALPIGSSTHADIASWSGNFHSPTPLAAPPASVQNNMLTGNTGKVFLERDSFLVPSGQFFDVLTSNLDDSDLSGENDYLINSILDVDSNRGQLPVGIRVQSYYVHFDSQNDNQSVNYVGELTFDSDILAVALLSNAGGYDTLQDTDPVFGSPGTIYPGRNVHGHDFDLRNRQGMVNQMVFDKIRISTDLRSIKFEVRNLDRIDSLRIITELPRSLKVSASPNSVNEDEGPDAGSITVQRIQSDISGSLTVDLQSFDTSEIQVASSVTFQPDEAVKDVPFDAIDDFVDDGVVNVSIVASASGFLGDATIINVHSVNHPPSIAPISNQTAQVGQTFSVFANASDPDNPADVLTFELVNPPTGAVVDNNGFIEWLPQQVGVETFTVRVWDDGQPNLFDDETFLVVVDPAPPVGVVAQESKLLDGIEAAGNLASSFASDNMRWSFDPSPTTNPFKQKVDLVVLTSNFTMDPSELSFLIESSMSGGMAGSVTQTVQMFNYQSGSWEFVSTVIAMNSDDSVELQLHGDLSRFVQPQLGEMLTRITWESTTFIAAPFFWTIDIDQILWLVRD